MTSRTGFDLPALRRMIGNPSAWDSYDPRASEQLRLAADEIERLQAENDELVRLRHAVTEVLRCINARLVSE